MDLSKMDLKKGISLIAIGFILILVNINLQFNGTEVNVLPAFAGWLLYFLAYDYMGSYLSDRKYMKWAALVMVFLTGADWFLSIYDPTIDIGWFKAIINTISAVYEFILFTAVERAAKGVQSSRTETIAFLKYFNFGIFLVLTVVGILAQRLPIRVLAVIVTVAGTIALGSAIFTAFTLMGLRGEVMNR